MSSRSGRNRPHLVGPLSRRQFLGAGVGSALALLPRSLRAQSERPNILFVFLDDLGAEVLGCYGGLSFETPRIDALAASGLRFENCYASPVCTPSRATALTGRYPFRTGMDDSIRPEPDEMLDPGIPNFASLLRSAGYRTAVSGKWQLARLDLHPDHPKRCGFEESFLWLWSIGPGRNTPRYWNAAIVENGALRQTLADEYGPDLYCDFLIDFMNRSGPDPFLAFYPMTLVHTPTLPTPNDGVMAWLAGFEQIRPFLAGTLAGRILGETWWASMVAYADHLIGRLIDALDLLELRERTLVIISADNGTPKFVRSLLDEQVIEGGKDSLTEAGTRVPLIASWPGHVEAGVTGDLVDLSDLLPTFAGVAGIDARASECDGVSFAPRLLRGEPSPRRAAFAQQGDAWFVRDRRWRLHHDGRLYDLSDRYSERLADPGPEAEAARERLAVATPIPR